jgi:thymidine phosphorylase
VDKLESIAGFRTTLTPEQFRDAETRRDLYHVWSREVEHSPENFRLIKSE